MTGGDGLHDWDDEVVPLGASAAVLAGLQPAPVEVVEEKHDRLSPGRFALVLVSAAALMLATFFVIYAISYERQDRPSIESAEIGPAQAPVTVARTAPPAAATTAPAPQPTQPPAPHAVPAPAGSYETRLLSCQQRGATFTVTGDIRNAEGVARTYRIHAGALDSSGRVVATATTDVGAGPNGRAPWSASGNYGGDLRRGGSCRVEQVELIVT